jgi:hypothetical protein
MHVLKLERGEIEFLLMYGTTGFALALGGYLGITQILSPANEKCLRPT